MLSLGEKTLLNTPNTLMNFCSQSLRRSRMPFLLTQMTKVPGSTTGFLEFCIYFTCFHWGKKHYIKHT